MAGFLGRHGTAHLQRFTNWSLLPRGALGWKFGSARLSFDPFAGALVTGFEHLHDRQVSDLGMCLHVHQPRGESLNGGGTPYAERPSGDRSETPDRAK